MTSNLNTIIRDYISDTDLLHFEKKYLEEKKVGAITATAQFEYGWCLIRSKYRDDVRNGVEIFQTICYSSSVDQRDYLFFIAIGYYKLGEFHIALKYVKRLLVIEPNNMQGRELEKAIEEKMASHGMMGMALVGGAVALVGLFVSMVRSR